MNNRARTAPLPLKGVRVLSLCLNIPGPYALLRCRDMGARCVKLEPPAGDPLRNYQTALYEELHAGLRVISADLKTETGQKALQRELARTDVLLTSFRPSALEKLGLGWKKLHRQFPALSQVSIVGARGAAAEEPGHDLTYLAANDLVNGLDLPATLFSDMGGALLVSEAVLQAVLIQQRSSKGVFREVALAGAAQWLAQPRAHGMTLPGQLLGGGHAGYRVYPCKDGRVAVAALEPHFAAALCEVVGVVGNGKGVMLSTATHEAIALFLSDKTRNQLEKLGRDKDIPLQALA